MPEPGTSLRVTLNAVIDPLRGSGATLLPHFKAVGVMVSVRNQGPGGYDSSDTGAVSLRSAAGPASPVYAPAGRCQTSLQNFLNEMSVGELRTGCVTFAVPAGREPLTVGFSSGAGGTDKSRSWVVP